ncbi:DUF3014 domain-containing protein [Psychromonas sp. PT13]|uniref:DUF3014 domain-containing protein n=1 Tax=Psychromonas sp. PT13 TaxID=3439547 RepID=UPI003EBC9766
MKSNIKKSRGFSITNTIIILGLIILVAGTYYYISKKNSLNDPITILQPKQEAESNPAAIPPAPITVTPQQDQDTEQPQEPEKTITAEPVSETPLPALDDSDAMVLNAVEQVSTLQNETAVLIPEEMVRNFVVFIDNLSKGDIITYFAPVISPKQPFSVTRTGQKIFLNTESYQRYDVYANLVDSIDIETALAQYQNLKPLIDEAYAEIGYSDGNFLNKLDNAIDLIINTPILDYPIELVSPSVMYKFADPQLEGLNDIQKQLIRMGPNNTFKIQEKLKQLQQRLQTLR